VAAYGAGAATGDAGDWILWHGYTFRLAPMDSAFVSRLRELDWIEGRTVGIEYR
jgi:hypothetical protein